MQYSLQKPEITLDELLQILQTFVHESKAVHSDHLSSDTLIKLSTIMDNSMYYLQIFKDCLPYIERSQPQQPAQNYQYPQ